MIKRRRVLSIIAGAGLSVGALSLFGVSALGKPQTWQGVAWQGVALGANAQIILDHENANELIKLALNEIARLEKIFSLYDKNSEISQLNKNGFLKNPSADFLQLLSICSQINQRTNGAFDPTIQPLWALYAKSYASGNAPSKTEITNIQNIVGWENIKYLANEVSFKKHGGAITLNGIAQGYIADKIGELFRKNGVSNVLINTGEISALGKSLQNENWQVKIKNTDKKVELNNMAIATSATLGTVFDKNGKVGHIIDPISGVPNSKQKQISVISHSAAIADGLSTGFLLMKKKDITMAKGDEEIIFV